MKTNLKRRLKMKRISLLLFLLLLSNLLYANPEAIIFGNIDNNHSSYVRLEIHNFNPETFQNETYSIKDDVEKDGSFMLKVPLISNGYTQVSLYFDNTKTSMFYLSPGDSLVANSDAFSIDNMTYFEGKGASVAEYGHQYYLNFYKPPYRYFLMGNRSELFLSRMKKYRDQKFRLVESHFNAGLDSSFYAYEKERVGYEYLVDILNYNDRHKNISNDTLKSLLIDVNTKSLTAFRSFPVYRDLIDRVIHFKIQLLGKKSTGLLKDELAVTREFLSGEILKYYLLKKVHEINNRGYRVEAEREILADQILENIEDPQLKKEIRESLESRQKWNRSYAVDFSQAALVVCLILFGISLIAFIVVKWSLVLAASRSNKRTKAPFLSKFNYMKVVKFVMLGSVALTIFIYLQSNLNYGLLPVLVVALILIFLALQIFWLIPEVLMKKGFELYGIITFILSSLFCAGQLVVLTKMSQMPPYYYSERSGSGLDNDIFGFVFASISLLLLLSFTYHYVNLMSKERKGFLSLFQQNILNKESFVNFIVMGFIYLLLAMEVARMGQLLHFVVVLLAIGIFYLFTFKIIPDYLFRIKIWLFLVQCAIIVMAVAFILMFSETYDSLISIRAQGIEASFSDLISFKILDIPLALTTLFLIVPATVYSGTRLWVIRQREQGFQMFRKKEAELEQLRSQVNPHFLFNTLNTLYAFALKEKSDKTADCIAKLANLMRFLIDDMEKESISLDSEIGYIEDYIQLQSMRSAVKHKIDIKVTADEEAEYLIAPMLLIPFVENAFKHGINPKKKSEFTFHAKAEKGDMQFVIENTIDRNFEAFYKEKGFGIGIENVKKRLDHEYPGSHNLSIAETDNKFIVILKIQNPNN